MTMGSIFFPDYIHLPTKKVINCFHIKLLLLCFY